MYLPRLKELRLEKKLTQKQMAHLLQVTRVAYHYYESGKRNPPYTAMIFLSEFYNVSIDYLVGKSESRYLKII